MLLVVLPVLDTTHTTYDTRRLYSIPVLPIEDSLLRLSFASSRCCVYRRESEHTLLFSTLFRPLYCTLTPTSTNLTLLCYSTPE